MNLRLVGTRDQVSDAVAALEKTAWLRITKTSRPYPVRRKHREQIRIYLDVQVDSGRAVDIALGGRPIDHPDVDINGGHREVWLVIGGVGGYVCGEPVADRPDGICGMPVETEPCPNHDRPEANPC